MDNIDYNILKLLSDGEYHSGEVLADSLATSRAAVSKRIGKLNAQLESMTNNSLVINSIIGRGYCLNYSFDYICLELISNLLIQDQCKDIATDITLEFLPVLGSTNDYLINKLIDNNKYHVCLAEQQTAGRGRNTVTRKKTWHSPFGDNIYCSVAWHYPGNQNTLLGLSLVAGVSIAEVIDELGLDTVQLKWPNDIFINNKKVAGILTEIYGEPNGGCKLVFGFGLNVHNKYNTNKIDVNNIITQPWTCLAEELKQKDNTGDIRVDLSRNKLIAKLLSTFISNYKLFIQQGLSVFTSKWQRYDLLNNKEIIIDIAGNKKQGRYCGIDNSGAMIVELDGKQQTYHSGEVSIGSF